MAGYLPDLDRHFLCFRDGASLRLSEAAPKACPFLLHSWLPYLFVLSRGGRFDWVGFTRSPDAVCVQCPNPKDGVETRLVTKDGRIFGEVYRAKGTCPFGHREGDSVELTPAACFKLPLEVCAAAFPWLTLLSRLGRPGNLASPELAISTREGTKVFTLAYRPGEGPDERVAARPCTVPEMKQGLVMTLRRLDYRCRYHKLPRRERYTEKTLGPEGCCLDLFLSAYASCLLGLYSADRPNDTFAVRCPHAGAEVLARVVVRKARFHLLWRLLSSLFSKEIPAYDCDLVLERSSPGCPMGLRTGARFAFNTWRKNELCPATFANTYFAAHNLVRGVDLPWGRAGSEGCLQCPDPASNLVFSLEPTERQEDPGRRR